jgi:hypothetical protein
MTFTDANRRMRENRMSGGVVGVTGAIPSPPPDQEMFGGGDLVGANLFAHLLRSNPSSGLPDRRTAALFRPVFR